jgi:hypothetical protein
MTITLSAKVFAISEASTIHLSAVDAGAPAIHSLSIIQ